MKFFAAAALLSLVPALAQAITVSYDTAYDKSSTSLSSVACSDGENGLLSRFPTFGALPKFPNIGGVPAVASWNSPACGTCWALTYTNSKGVKKTVNILAVDHSDAPDYNISLAAMNELTGGNAAQLGRVTVTAAQVAPSNCGLKNW
ncbi:Cerato-platanin [Panaeolus papilionaceus]|nr:Cerato-platanin [Panaeolus papilionaceus]